jgi:PAS domain S-box-containing protein
LLPYRTIDITERRQAEEALQVNKWRLSSILQELPASVLIAAKDGRLVFGNRRVEQLFGTYPRSQSIEDYHDWKAFTTDGEPYQPEQVPMARALQSGEVVIGEEMRFRRSDGSWLLCRVNAAPIRDEQGQIVEAVLIFDEVNKP